MKLVNNFYNKAVVAIKAKYFTNDTMPRKVSYALETMNNGCLTYGGLINKLAACINAPKLELHEVIASLVADFSGYEYSPNEVDPYEGLDVCNVYAETDEYNDISQVTIELETGEVVVLDYNDCFEIGGLPYRLTYVIEPDSDLYLWNFEVIEPSEDEDLIED